jgi:polyisoprenoid-binding protein YceI
MLAVIQVRGRVMLRFVPRLRGLAPCVFVLILSALIWTAGASPAAAQEWKVDKRRSSVTVQLSMDGQPVEGRFGGYKAEILFDPEEPGDGAISIVIDAASLRTGDIQRDATLFSPQWLSGGAYPDIRLTSRTIKEIDAGNYRMEADLTIKGVTKRVAVPLTVEDEGTDGEIQAEARASQAAFGLGRAEASDEITLVINLAATNLTN